MKKRNDDYFERMEFNCYSSLTYFNEDQKIFATTDQMRKFSCVDASGETEGGCRALMELKRRPSIEGFDDAFIESKKIAYLMLSEQCYGFVPLYIYFTDFEGEDGIAKKVYVWRLDKLTGYNYYPRRYTYSKGYEETESVEKFGLLFSDATVYELTPNGYKLLTTNGIRGC